MKYVGKDKWNKMMYYYSFVGYDYLVNSLCIVVLYYCLFV